MLTATRNTSALTRCTHCDLPVPRGLIEIDHSEQFCCSGCRAAWHLIHDHGLDSFYRIVERNSGQSVADPSSHGDHQEFDQPTFLNRFARPVAVGELETTLLLDGIHCAACIWLIEKLPRILPGVVSVKLNWAKRTATIHWRTSEVALSQIAKTLSQLGYTPHPLRASENEARRRNENRSHMIRIGVAAAAAGNNMLISTALYLGMFAQMSAGMTTLLRIASCVIGMAALIGPGQIFLRGAIGALRTRTAHMDLPIALGLAVGSLAGLANTIRGAGEIYFDSLSVLIFLLLIGRWIQCRQQNRAADAVEMLYALTPRKARRIAAGRVVEVFVDSVEIGDQLEVRAGDVFPVDGMVDEGAAEVDESILTGESRAVTKRVGDLVLAGTQSINSRLILRATTTHSNTRLSRIVELVENASLQKPQIVQWANRVGGYFVAVVLVLAFVTLATWLWIDSTVAIDRTVALLIVACPCALALATPLAISVALGRAAKHRIMVKGGDVFQSLNRPGMIWLDKTGTLTTGNLEVVSWHGITAWNKIIGHVEATSSHPVAKAIVEYVGIENATTPTVVFDRVFEHAGEGIAALFGGNELLIGNNRLLQNNDVPITRGQRRVADRIVGQGCSPCWITLNGKVISVLAIGDRIRAGNANAIQGLKSTGWRVGILSGDHRQIVERVAQRLGIERELAIGEAGPEAKIQLVRHSLRDHETVVMVGDGVNDSAALAAASIGIAVHGGAEASLAAASVYFADDGLRPLLRLLEISRSTARTMKINLCISISYNIAGAVLAFLGFVNPLVAAILMPISSLTVVAISMTAGKVPGTAQASNSEFKNQKSNPGE